MLRKVIFVLSPKPQPDSAVQPVPGMALQVFRVFLLFPPFPAFALLAGPEGIFKSRCIIHLYVLYIHTVCMYVVFQGPLACRLPPAAAAVARGCRVALSHVCRGGVGLGLGAWFFAVCMPVWACGHAGVGPPDFPARECILDLTTSRQV